MIAIAFLFICVLLTASSRGGGWKPKSWYCGISSMSCSSAHHADCICVGPGRAAHLDMSDEFRRKLKLIKCRDINRVYGWGTWIRTRINGVRVLYSYQTSIQLHHTPLRSDS